MLNGVCLHLSAAAGRFTHGAAGTGAPIASGSRGPRRERGPRAPKSQLCFAFSESQNCQYGDAVRTHPMHELVQAALV